MRHAPAALLVPALLATALLAGAAPALAADDVVPRIVVAGTGSVTTPPDRATIGYTVRGEGQTSDAAVTALVDKRRAIDGGIASLRVPVQSGASRVSVAEVRSPDCRQGYNSPQLSAGPCAVLGYAAELQVTVKTSATKQAGTMVGLLGRLGAANPHVESFDLVDPRAAQGAAIVGALADARAKAQAVAQGAGVRLGRLLSASNTGAGYQPEGDVIVTGSRVYAPAAPPPPPPPIAVDLTPEPITTRAQVTVAYEIAP